EGGTGLTAVFTYATALFDPSTIAGLAQRFTAIVSAVASDPGVLVGDIELLTPDERYALSPVTGPPDAAPRTMIDIFEDAVASNPDGEALVCGDESLS
ncbi:hypothetical protein, partial [Escherichia coli]|uniref:hypothetical protein n=1 Tax=Escherichia coli TaxID=562 RepID=UPI003D2EBF40